MREGKYTKIAAIAAVLTAIIAFLQWQFPNSFISNTPMKPEKQPFTSKDSGSKVNKMEFNTIDKQPQKTVTSETTKESEVLTSKKEHPKIQVKQVKETKALILKANILIFNACNKKTAHITLKKIMNKTFKGSDISVQYKWLLRHEMKSTYIYYITQGFLEEAELLEKWLPGKQNIVDYQNQLTTYYPDPRYKMIGLEQRDIVVFLGNDYQKILDGIEK